MPTLKDLLGDLGRGLVEVVEGVSQLPPEYGLGTVNASFEEKARYLVFISQYLSLKKGARGEEWLCARLGAKAVIDHEVERNNPYAPHMRKLYDTLDTIEA